MSSRLSIGVSGVLEERDPDFIGHSGMAALLSANFIQKHSAYSRGAVCRVSCGGTQSPTEPWCRRSEFVQVEV